MQQLLYQQPLVIHTRILPPGVKADDPRLANARVMSERRYISEDTSLPHPAFTATLHPSLLSSSSEPATRLVSGIVYFCNVLASCMRTNYSRLFLSEKDAHSTYLCANRSQRECYERVRFFSACSVCLLYASHFFQEAASQQLTMRVVHVSASL